jgi:hypothetical protein
MQLKHPNIVECLGATIEPKQIVMELMENGRVMDYLEEKKDPSACRTRLVSIRGVTARFNGPSTDILGIRCR